VKERRDWRESLGSSEDEELSDAADFSSGPPGIDIPGKLNIQFYF